MQAPVNGLPPEVLCRVFQHRNCGQDLVVATHVCRYWRSTLISDPSLWTSILLNSTSDANRTQTYLERSKSATLDIKIISDHLKDLHVFQNLSPHISRTRSFIIDGLGPNFIAISSLLLCKPVPSLEYLSMSLSIISHVPSTTSSANKHRHSAPQASLEFALFSDPLSHFPI
jgi:hypothetical protein